MKQYKITSADFVSPGEALVPDTILSPEDKEFIANATNSKLAAYIKSQIDQRKEEQIAPIDITVGKNTSV